MTALSAIGHALPPPHQQQQQHRPLTLPHQSQMHTQQQHQPVILPNSAVYPPMVPAQMYGGSLLLPHGQVVPQVYHHPAASAQQSSPQGSAAGSNGNASPAASSPNGSVGLLIHKHHTGSAASHPPQPNPPPKIDPPAPTRPEEGILVPECLPGGIPSGLRPCLHNDWDDVRTRKGSKILRCRLCQRKWKLASSSVPRCAAFLQNLCPNGLQCSYLHVHKKKSHSSACDMQIDELMPPLASPEATPPASPGAVLSAIRSYMGATSRNSLPHSPVNPQTRRSTAELLQLLKETGMSGAVPAAGAAGAAELPEEESREEPVALKRPKGGLAARRSFANQAVVIPNAPLQVKTVTPTGVVFQSPTARRGELVASSEVPFSYLSDLLSNSPAAASPPLSSGRRSSCGGHPDPLPAPSKRRSDSSPPPSLLSTPLAAGVCGSSRGPLPLQNTVAAVQSDDYRITTPRSTCSSPAAGGDNRF